MVDQRHLINMIFGTLVLGVFQLLNGGQAELHQPDLEGVSQLLDQGVGRGNQRAINQPSGNSTKDDIKLVRGDVFTRT